MTWTNVVWRAISIYLMVLIGYVPVAALGDFTPSTLDAMMFAASVASVSAIKNTGRKVRFDKHVRRTN